MQLRSGLLITSPACDILPSVRKRKGSFHTSPPKRRVSPKDQGHGQFLTPILPLIAYTYMVSRRYIAAAEVKDLSLFEIHRITVSVEVVILAARYSRQRASCKLPFSKKGEIHHHRRESPSKASSIDQKKPKDSFSINYGATQERPVNPFVQT